MDQTKPEPNDRAESATSARASAPSGMLDKLGRWLELPEQSRRAVAFALLALAVACLFVTVDWLPTVHDPISGEHYHRQADSFSVALNFLEHPNFFYPRIHYTNEFSGIRGMEAPIYPYLVSLALRAGGPQEWLGRLVSLVFFLVAVGAMLSVLRRDAGRFAALGALVAIACSPMTLYYARQVQPDMPMLALGVLGIALARHWNQRGWGYVFIAQLIFGVGILTKYPLIFAWPGLVAASVRIERSAWRENAKRIAGACVPLVLLALWMVWAEHLNRAYAGGTQYFAANPSLSEMLHDALAFDVRHSIGYLLPRYASELAFFPIVVLGATTTLRRDRIESALPWWGVLLGGIFMAITLSPRFYAHYYYAILYLPPVWYFGALGLHKLVSPPTSRGDWAALALALGLWIALAATQLVPQPAAFHAWRFAIVATVMGVGLLWYAFSSQLTLTASAIAILGVSIAAPLATQATADLSLARLKERRTRVGLPQQFVARAEALRKVLAKYVPPDQKVMFICHLNPWHLLAARHKGWHLTSGEVDQRGVAYYRATGARWAIICLRGDEFSGLPRELKGARPIVKSREWLLYDLDLLRR